MGRLDVWTPAQRGVLIAAVMCLTVYVSVRWSRNSMYVSDPQPPEPLHVHDLADRIDPNTADAATLSALPLIGEKRARDIIDYRQRFAASHADRPAYRQVEDLMIVRGIGASIVDQLRPYLIFPQPTARPGTRPTSGPAL